MNLEDGRQLTYCTNVHPGESAADVLRVLDTDVPAVRDALGFKASFGVGLRVSDAASRDLSTPQGLAQLRDVLDRHEAYVFTINGFPYGTFHGAPVKDQVHRPDWTEPERPAYLIRLARLLAALSPPGAEGSISTSPLGYRAHHSDPHRAMSEAARALADVAASLVELEAETGQRIHVDLEPEPDGLLETLAQARSFFVDTLFREGRDHLMRQSGIRAEEAERRLRRHLGVCLDVCHAAVVFESLDDGLAGLRAEAIEVGKIQLSSALEARWRDVHEAQAVARALTPFDEPVYLHQVAMQMPSGAPRRFTDLEPALAALSAGDGEGMLRTHFHVPLFEDDYGALSSTQSAVREVLERLRRGLACRHLEVETYTWGVLPNPPVGGLHASIARELAWVLESR
ncbi:MAG: metabolite traffic protein EboE [Myxococcota bacterium]